MLNIRCAFCQTPYTLSRVAMLDALQEVDANKLTHYDAHCPRCRRATSIPRQRLEMAMPKWREELKAFEAEMKANPQQEAPSPEAAPIAQAQPKPEPKAVKEKPAAKAKPAPAAAQEKKAPAAKAKKPAAAASSKEKKTTKKSK